MRWSSNLVEHKGALKKILLENVNVIYYIKLIRIYGIQHYI